MTEKTPDPAAQREQREQLTIALGGMLIPLFFVVLFAVCIIGTTVQQNLNPLGEMQGRFLVPPAMPI